MKIKISTKEKKKIPNYRNAGRATTRKCGTCKSYSGGSCSKFSQSVKADFLCNAWTPEVKSVRMEAESIKQARFDYGSTYFPLPDYVSMGSFFISHSVSREDLDHIESEPHITLLYGLRNDSEDLVKLAMEYSAPIKVKIGEISLFENEDFDVLKLSIEGDQIQDAFNRISELVPNSNSHPRYIPHITIAYLKPGTGKKYLEIDNPLQGHEFILDELIYSSSNNDEICKISLRDSRDYGFKVIKEAGGSLRWVSRSSTSFKDKDSQYMSQKGLEQAVRWNDERKEYGPLRFWHLEGVDLGDCDFSMLHGKVLIESGTFRKKEYGEALMNNPDIGGVSIGFKHPKEEPVNGVFNNFLITERSVMPSGKESNYFTGFTVKGHDMSKTKELVKISELVDLLGGDEALKLLESAKATQDQAEEAGHTFKEAFDIELATPEQIIAYGEQKKKELEEAEEAKAQAQEEETEEEVSLDFDGLKEMIVSAVKEAVLATLPAKTEKETRDEEEISSKIEMLQKELKELKGDAPRANGSYRASADPDTKTTTKEVAPDENQSDVDKMAASFTHQVWGGVN